MKIPGLGDRPSTKVNSMEPRLCPNALMGACLLLTHRYFSTRARKNKNLVDHATSVRSESPGLDQLCHVTSWFTSDQPGSLPLARFLTGSHPPPQYASIWVWSLLLLHRHLRHIFQLLCLQGGTLTPLVLHSTAHRPTPTLPH